MLVNLFIMCYIIIYNEGKILFNKIKYVLVLLVFGVILTVSAYTDKNVYADIDGGCIYFHLDNGTLEGSFIEDRGDGDYCLTFRKEDVGSDLPIPDGPDGAVFVGWMDSVSQIFEEQITLSLNQKTLVGVWDGKLPSADSESTKIRVFKPEIDSTHFEYNEAVRAVQTYHVEEKEYYTVIGNQQIEAGKYNVIVRLNDKEVYEWSDGTTDDIMLSFEIHSYDIEWVWSEDYLTAMAKIKCKNSSCLDYAEIYADSIKSIILKSPTAIRTGEKLYEASVTYKGIERKTSLRVVLPMLEGSMTTNDKTISVYNENGFESQELNVSTLSNDKYNNPQYSRFELIKVLNIEFNGTNSGEDYDIVFDLSKYEQDYKDFAIVYYDEQGNSVLAGEGLLNGKIKIENQKLGRFAIYGTEKTDDYSVTNFTICAASLLVFLIVDLVLLLLVIVKMYRVIYCIRALKRF